MDNERSPAIRSSGSRKSSGDRIVLGGLDLSFPEETIFSLPGRGDPHRTTRSPPSMDGELGV
ncbi:hypothetical protein [Nocardia carnea]|uniref:hypothetical protein n=1 Tax=Nocardia carnea TaxID=37328 RepID=UPI002454C821|nr:hypothetical protein [Nocardia carnea]